MTGVDSSPALATCKTSHVLLAGVSGGFPEVLPFHPTYGLARLDMSEIILKETLNYYIVYNKTGFTGVFIIFLSFALKHKLWVHVSCTCRTA